MLTESLGFVLFGYDQGVMSGIITAPPFNNLFPATKDNSTMQGFVTAIYEIGCLMGAITILTFGDFLGRRRSMMIGGSIMILGVIIQVTSERGATPLAQFIIGRTITGVGNGINTSTIDLVKRYAKTSPTREVDAFAMDCSFTFEL